MTPPYKQARARASRLLVAMLVIPLVCVVAQAKTLSGKISAISTNLITVQAHKLSAKSFTIPFAARITLNGSPSSMSSLQIGQFVSVTSADGFSATSVSARTFEGAEGKIMTVSAQSVVVMTHSGKERTFLISNVTTATLDGRPTALAGVAVGQFARVQTNDGITAASISAKTHADIAGTISVINPNFVTITYRSGETRTFAITPSTAVKMYGMLSTSSSLSVGQSVTVSTADGGTALAISLGTHKTHRRHR